MAQVLAVSLLHWLQQLLLEVKPAGFCSLRCADCLRQGKKKTLH